jgi:hypothetical protein
MATLQKQSQVMAVWPMCTSILLILSLAPYSEAASYLEHLSTRLEWRSLAFYLLPLKLFSFPAFNQ